MSGSPALQEIAVVIGQPVAGNPTQFMMDREVVRSGLDWRILSCDVAPEALAEALRGVRGLGFRGAIIGPPHQLAAAKLVDECLPSAAACQAVNLITCDGGRLIGDQTCGAPFLAELQTRIDPAGRNVVLYGAGGVARALALQLGAAGVASLVIVNRTLDRATELATIVNQRYPGLASAVDASEFRLSAESDIVVHATSRGNDSAAGWDRLEFGGRERSLVVADVVYYPLETPLLRSARQHGCATIDGLGMLAGQVAEAWQRWTGRAPDLLGLREAAEEYLSL